jgi:hypothetical protein
VAVADSMFRPPELDLALLPSAATLLSGRECSQRTNSRVEGNSPALCSDYLGIREQPAVRAQREEGPRTPKQRRRCSNARSGRRSEAIFRA